MYIISWILFRLLVEINCQTIPFNQVQREYHTATLINNKLYILGGISDGTTDIGIDFFYLDISVPFNTQNLSWINLSSNNIVPPPSHYGATSAKGGENNNTLFLYGGFPYLQNETMSLVYTFDTQTNLWTIPTIAGEIYTTRKGGLTEIIDHGKMYLWGGFNGSEGTNDMLILDTINLILGNGSLVEAPTPRFNYGAILTTNNSIIYIDKKTF